MKDTRGSFQHSENPPSSIFAVLPCGVNQNFENNFAPG